MYELKEIRECALKNVDEIVKQNTQAVKEAYELVTKLGYLAQNYGLLALEEEITYLLQDMPMCDNIVEMIEMIMNGIESAFISEVLTLKFMTNQYKGIDAFLYYIYARSTLMIQQGVPPYQLEIFFNSIIPNNLLYFDKQAMLQEEYRQQKLQNLKNDLSEIEKQRLKEVSEQLGNLSGDEWKEIVSRKGFYGWDKLLPLLEEETKKLIATYINKFRYEMIMTTSKVAREEELLELLDELEIVIRKMKETIKDYSLLKDIVKHSDTEIQELIKEVDKNTLTLALKGEKEEIKIKFLNNVSTRFKYELEEDMEYIGPVRRYDVEEAQKKLVQIAKEKLGWD